MPKLTLTTCFRGLLPYIFTGLLPLPQAVFLSLAQPRGIFTQCILPTLV
jgi:hypothetical protein